MELPPLLLSGVACISVAISFVGASAAAGDQPAPHSFAIGETDFLLDGKPFLIRSGEMHAARIPREYWRHRLQMVKAMGCNTVCAYLFWNQHEPQPGEFDFSGQADVAEYCRLAREAGLWVILRPGPYSCAEWDLGGFPSWLLKTPDIAFRTRDSRYLQAAQRYLLRVGQELAPLQITRGGPIIMAQVENEYGSYGNDREYVGIVRDCLKEAGFEVPLFTCDGPSQLKNDVREDLFCVVNFGDDPAGNFKALREIRPRGPLMCGEYYPGWFDSWGKPHHTGDTRKIVSELRYMLEHNQSFSIYMVHGGTSFGFTSGANSPPFSPQSTSYDYDAPIDEAGRPTAKFQAIRELFSKNLLAGETLPDVPPANQVVTIPEITFNECAELLADPGKARAETRPRSMEMYDQAGGCILYRATLPAGEAGTLTIRDARDCAQLFLDGDRIGILDRRYKQNSVKLPTRDKPARLDLLVEAMGRVNYGGDLHDRKGITEKVELSSVRHSRELTGWEVFSLPFDADHLARLKFAEARKPRGKPAVYRATFTLAETGDSFLDMRTWSKGAVWVNGRNLGRYWRIGPQQTLYLPGCWLKKGRNEILVLDVDGGVEKPVVQGLNTAILNDVRLDPLAPTAHRASGQTLRLDGVSPIYQGTFAGGTEWQVAGFAAVKGRYFCFEALNSQGNDPFTTCAELCLLDADGKELPRDQWRVIYADSEELSGEDGSATNAFDALPATFWHTQWEGAKPSHPHHLVIDLGSEQAVGGVRYLPRQDSPNGRIKDFRLYLRAMSFSLQ
jgi:beta-galactosidase